jgi:hypothetical protein
MTEVETFDGPGRRIYEQRRTWCHIGMHNGRTIGRIQDAYDLVVYYGGIFVVPGISGAVGPPGDGLGISDKPESQSTPGLSYSASGRFTNT